MKHRPGELRSLGDQQREIDVQIAPWPGGAPFALFLSHDIDQIYDRGFFRFLGDVNHLWHVLFRSAPGAAGQCAKRIARAFLRPRAPGRDVETILEIERRFGFRSTFFLLEDRTFNRLGGRYCYADAATRRIAGRIVDAGCEIAMHGAYHNFNDPEAYRAQARSFREAFGRESRGIRNHYLRHDGIETWKAQREAGFSYDATYGYNDRIGVRDGRSHPFFPFEHGVRADRGFVVLPMTIMDCTLFWYLRLPASEALALCQRAAEQIIAAGGLLCLNWHNNYFHEEEFKDWQDVYMSLMGWLADQHPWNATGEEIAEWWASSSIG
jgi:peptidoglycan/xylan/chitin deacetylase (PgdA/CDA1 family)